VGKKGIWTVRYVHHFNGSLLEQVKEGNQEKEEMAANPVYL